MFMVVCSSYAILIVRSIILLVGIGLVGRVFAYGSPGFNPRSSHTEDLKYGTWYLFA